MKRYNRNEQGKFVEEPSKFMQIVLTTWIIIKAIWYTAVRWTKEAISGDCHFGHYWPYYTILALVLTTYWPAITDYAKLVDWPNVTFANEIIAENAEIVVMEEGRFEELLAQAESEVRAEKEENIKQEAMARAKARFDDEWLKMQLGLK